MIKSEIQIILLSIYNISFYFRYTHISCISAGRRHKCITKVREMLKISN